MSRAAETSTPINPVLANRWSPRSYDATKTLTKADLNASFEAARWSPSANNNQEWRYIVGFRGDATFETIVGTLAGWNTAWAPNAGALVVTIAETTNADGQTNPYALYDLGQSVAHFSVQAHSDGLYVHQVAGTDVAALKAAFNLPDNWDAFTVFTVGHLAEADALPEPLAEREKAPRTRRDLNETVFYGAL